MKTPFQIKIETLKDLIKKAEIAQSSDSSLSGTLEFEPLNVTDTYLGNDHFRVYLKSGYAECMGKQITVI